MVTESGVRWSPGPVGATNLPTLLSSFVNREDDIAGIVGEMARSRRLLTLVGPGGVGKTRLALEVARRSLTEFPGGTWLIDLSAVSSPELVPPAVASVLSLEESSGAEFITAVARRFEGRRTLVLLDNCEHLRSACAQFAMAVLAAAPGLVILATSREALGVPGERAWRVGVFELPRFGEVVDPARVERYSALRLWKERAAEVVPDFAISNENVNCAIETCRRLDGMPLAIELAASRLSSMSGEDILALIDARFPALGKRSSSRVSRQRTLRSLIDWSYELLDQPQRALFRRLGVFAGGWNIDAAIAVCGEPGETGDDLVDCLADLVDKSLVVFEVNEGPGRYRFLNTIWGYAQEKLGESSDAEMIAARHSAWCRALVTEAERNLRGPDQAAWLQRLETEMPNLRAALAYCLENDVAGGLELAGMLVRFWRSHAHLAEGRRWLDQLLAAGARTTPGAQALGSYGAGVLAFDQADYAVALRLFGEATLHFEALNDWAGKGDALTFVANIAWRQGDYARAAELHGQSLAIYRDLGDERRTAAALNNLGLVRVDQVDYAEARSLYEESLRIKRRLGDELGSLSSLHNLGILAQYEGDWERALAIQQAALVTARNLGDRRATAAALLEVGKVSLKLGDAGSAGAAYFEARDLLDELGDPVRAVHCVEGLAMVAAALKEWELAAELFGGASAERYRLGTPIAPPEAALLEPHLAKVRATLGEERFTRASQGGAAAGLDAGQVAQIRHALARSGAKLAARPDDDPLSGLTARESEILGLVAQGLTNQEMAERLVVSVRTVETHLGNIYGKIGARGRAEAVAFAVRRGLGGTASPAIGEGSRPRARQQ